MRNPVHIRSTGLLLLIWGILGSLIYLSSLLEIYLPERETIQNASGEDYPPPELRLLPPVLREHRAPQARIDQARRDRPAGVFVELQHSIAATIEEIVNEFMKPWETDYPKEVFLPETLIQAQANDPSLRNNTLLVQIENYKAKFTHLFYPPKRHTRRQSLEEGIRKLLELDRTRHPRTLPDNVTFLVVLNDGFRTSVPAFTSARHWSNVTAGVPVPLGNLRGYKEGWGSTIVGWDAYVQQHIASHRNEISWDQKIPKAVFRGAFSPFKYKLGTCNAGLDLCELPKSWKEVNRGKLFALARQAPSLFDVGFNKIRADCVEELASENVTVVPGMSLVEQQRYKYVINMGNNADWAERLRHLLYTDMLVVRHEAETQEWFYPALQPYIHYLPVGLTLDDLIEQVQWATDHDTTAQEMAHNGFAFAQHFLSEKAMLHYWTVVLQKLAKLQKAAAHERRQRR